MAKYVLNSGGLKNNLDMSKRFFAEIVKDLGPNPKILVCYFAQPREDWEIKFEEDKKSIPDLVPEGISPEIELALPSTFEEQINKSDVIYFKGGDDYLIMYWLKKFDIPTIWKNKVIATSSASSLALSKQFWGSDWRECMDGMNILPIKFIAHYNSSYGAEDPRGPIDWENALKELEEYGDKDLPIYALEEGHYKVIEQ